MKIALTMLTMKLLLKVCTGILRYIVLRYTEVGILMLLLRYTDRDILTAQGKQNFIVVI